MELRDSNTGANDSNMDAIIKAYLMPETARITLRTASLLDAIVDRLANVPDNFAIVFKKDG